MGLDRPDHIKYLSNCINLVSQGFHEFPLKLTLEWGHKPLNHCASAQEN